jgi:hypothetical protein
VSDIGAAETVPGIGAEKKAAAEITKWRLVNMRSCSFFVAAGIGVSN